MANLISSSISNGLLNEHQFGEILLTACNYYQVPSTSRHVQKCSTCQKKCDKNASETFAEC